MLYPQTNLYRQRFDLSGFWDLRFDPSDDGHQSGWSAGFSGGRPAAVPASWNEQFADGRDYLGRTWYQTGFDLPRGWDTARERIRIRFESVSYLAEVWLNGMRLGVHEGGHLPFEFDISAHVQPEENRLVLCVEGQLASNRVPPGNLRPEQGFVGTTNFPAASYDFFPYCGIQRPVLLYTTPLDGIDDLTVTTDIASTTGRVHVRLHRAGGDLVTARFSLRGTPVSAETSLSGDALEVTLDLPDAGFWSPASPQLYDLSVELSRGGNHMDRYTLPIGIRTVAIDGSQLLLNGAPIYLRGFGRHEDFPVVGKGIVPAVIIKDYALMQWIGANSFRTSHYPYSDAMMSLADRLGFLVIDETPAVGLFFGDDAANRRLALCRQYTQDLIARDKNHPSVIMWSVANEPHSRHPDARAVFHDLYTLAKRLDSTRPVTLASYLGADEESFEFLDVVCLNRYLGWYTQSGQLDEAIPLLSAELDALHAKFGKPIIMTEFGADAVAGHHAQPPEMFSEEFQAELIARYIALFKTKPYMIGEHIWNLCDFKTSQAVHRVGALNLKGIFTRDRRPKLAAQRVRELWSGSE
jgi:beta-glucuronidase